MKARTKLARTARSAPVAETPVAPQPPALIVFGRDNRGKRRAAWFEAADAEAATAVAATMRLRALRVANEAGSQLAGQLARGRVLPSGRANVPFTKSDLYARIVELAGEEAGLSIAKEDQAEARPDAAKPSTGASAQLEGAKEKDRPTGSTEDETPASGNQPAATASESAAERSAPRPSDGTFVGQPHPKDRSEIGLGSIVLAHESAEEGWWEAEVIGFNGRVFSLRWRDYPTQPTILRKAGELALMPLGEA